MVVKHEDCLVWIKDQKKRTAYINRVAELYYIATGNEMQFLDCRRIPHILMGVLVPEERRVGWKYYPSLKQVAKLLLEEPYYLALRAVFSVVGFVDRYNAHLIISAVKEANEDPELAPFYAVQKVLQVRGDEI